MSRLRAAEVFVPSSFPTHTYVERASVRLEELLRDAISTPGQVVSLSGPSKSGKTVLVERVIGRDSLISVSGAGLQAPDEIWDRILDWMDVPDSTTRSRSLGGTVSVEGSAKGGVSVPLLAKGAVGVTGKGEATRMSEESEDRERRGLKPSTKHACRQTSCINCGDPADSRTKASITSSGSTPFSALKRELAALSGWK